MWTREAGPGSLAISVEGPSKAEIDFKDRKDGSCYVSYVVGEPGASIVFKMYLTWMVWLHEGNTTQGAYINPFLDLLIYKILFR